MELLSYLKEGNGDFMPLEFWYAMSLILGAALVGIVSWMINKFLAKLELTLDELKKSNELNERRLDQHERQIDDHEKEINEIIQEIRRRKR